MIRRILPTQQIPQRPDGTTAPATWTCDVTLPTPQPTLFDPTHGVRAVISNDAYLTCFGTPRLYGPCGTELAASPVVSLTGGIDWQSVDRATWTGGTDPVIPRREVTSTEIPTPGTTPRLVHDWWLNTNAAQMEYAIQNYPRQIGWLDGVPVTDRDKANRIILKLEADLLTSRATAPTARISLIQTMIDQGRASELYPGRQRPRHRRRFQLADETR